MEPLAPGEVVHLLLFVPVDLSVLADLVDGLELTYGLADGLADGLELADGLVDGLTDGLELADGLELTDGLVDGLELGHT